MSIEFERITVGYLWQTLKLALCHLSLFDKGGVPSIAAQSGNDDAWR